MAGQKAGGMGTGLGATQLGFQMGGPKGAAVGAVVDVGALIANSIAQGEIDEEEARRWQAEHGLNKMAIMHEIEEKKRKAERHKRFSTALSKHMGMGGK